jgi:hypothetical protein
MAGSQWELDRPTGALMGIESYVGDDKKDVRPIPALRHAPHRLTISSPAKSRSELLVGVVCYAMLWSSFLFRRKHRTCRIWPQEKLHGNVSGRVCLMLAG